MSELPDVMEAAVTVGHGGADMIEFRTDVADASCRVRALRSSGSPRRPSTTPTSGHARGSTERPTTLTRSPDGRGRRCGFPLIQGIDVAGVVAAVGDAADEGWLGRRVIVDSAAEYDHGAPSRIIGSEVDGGFAQFFVVLDRPAPRRHRIAAERRCELSCLPTAYGTAARHAQPCGDVSRVNGSSSTGASGGVGMAAVQLALARGCDGDRADQRVEGGPAARGRGRPRCRSAVSTTSPTLPRSTSVVDVVGGDEFGSVVRSSPRRGPTA